MDILRTPSLLIRPFAPTDVESLARAANDRRVSQNLRDRFPFPYERADAEAWIAFCMSQREPIQSFAIDLGGDVIGGIGIEPLADVHRMTAEIGYWLGVAHWGHGYATEAVRSVVHYAFERFDFERLQAGVYDWNPASGRVLEKAGFGFEGRFRRHVVKDGRMGDVLVYSLLRNEAH